MLTRPRRLTPPAAPGTLLKCFAEVPRKPRREETDNDPKYLEEVRTLPCLYCGVEPCEAAHVRMASASFRKSSGIGKKPADRWALSLCASCHRLAKHAQHNRGERAFWEGIGINPLIVCDRLYAQRGDLPAMRAVVIKAIAERG